MSEDAIIKKYPVTTAEVAKMLGIQGVSKDLPLGTFNHAESDLPVANLPVVSKVAFNAHNLNIEQHIQDAHAAADAADASNVSEKPVSSKLLNTAKAVGPFLAVFVVGLFLYYYFFSAVNFSALLTSSAPKSSAPQVTAIQQLESQDSVAYQQWIKGFYYDVSDPKLLDPEADNSGNGLTNFEKYLLNLNPKSYDTLGIGMADSQALSQGINPLTGGPVTSDQKTILAKYVDMEVAMNRLALYNLQNPGQVAGISVDANGNLSQQEQATSSGLNIRGPISNTTNATSAQTIYSVNPVNDSGLSINTSIPGRLQIPDLKINVPIIWSTDPNNFDTDLQSGVIHYPGTAMPGQIGTTYIAGHSSNYVWAKGSYNQIFSTLGKLPNNASFTIAVTETNGKTATLNYVVTSEKQYAPTDEAQFANSGQSVVALSTCWPVGSTAKRLVVFAQLTQVQQ